MHPYLAGKSTREANYTEKVLSEQGHSAKHVRRLRGRNVQAVLRESGAIGGVRPLEGWAFIRVPQSTKPLKRFSTKACLQSPSWETLHTTSPVWIFIMHVLGLKVLRIMVVKKSLFSEILLHK